MKSIWMMMFWTLAVSSLLITGLFQLRSFGAKENVELGTQEKAPDKVVDQVGSIAQEKQSPKRQSAYIVDFADSGKNFVLVADAMRLRLRLLGLPDSSLVITKRDDGRPLLLVEIPDDLYKVMEFQGVFELRARAEADGSTSKDSLVLNRRIPGFESTGNGHGVIVYPESNEKVIDFFLKHNQDDIVLVSGDYVVGTMQNDEETKKGLADNRISFTVLNPPNPEALRLISVAMLTPYPVPVRLVRK